MKVSFPPLAKTPLTERSWKAAVRLAELDGIVRSGKTLGYALADAGAQFQATFPGWQPWSNPAAYQAQTTRALDTMRASLAAISRQSQSFGPGEDTLAAIRVQMEGTAGHQQALEQLATLAGFQAQEQLLTRQSLAVAANVQAVANGYWLNREAQGQATVTVLLTESALAADENRSPGWTFVPGWWPFG